ncbi:MAG: hypothetical protein IID17_08950 [Nitrospinae bacterium]|nr:hypothetical protein [Nitrospinota bacterium]
MLTDRLVAAWRDAARRSLDAGFQAVELHFAHGYLAHEFLSPLSNDRSDRYGGSPENRARFPMEIVRAVREVWPGELPLLVRISATEYVDGGWDLDDSVRLCEWMRDAGVDMIDVSSGGNSPRQNMAPAPGYQVPFASEIKRRTGMPTGAVGLITEPWQAERILENGEADVVLLGRELLRNPYWPLHAAAELGDDVDYWPPQYRRAAVKP